MKLYDRLTTVSSRFSFVQLIRLLSRFLNDMDTDIQFKVNPSRRFPVAEIEALEVKEADTAEKRYTMMVNFMGLVGHDGIMPAHINEIVLQRLLNKDDTLIEFLNIFHHHILRLYSIILHNRRFFINAEKRKSDVMLQALHNITGQAGQNRDSALYYAGLFSHQARSAEGLQTMLANYFELPIAVSQYTPTWIDLEKSDMAIISAAQNKQVLLGETATLGNRVWHVQNQFTIWIGPINFKLFKQFLPEGKYLAQLIQLAQDYVGLEYEFTIKLLLSRDSIPLCKLRYKKSEQLGWTTWLNGRKTQHNYSVVSLSSNEQGGAKW